MRWVDLKPPGVASNPMDEEPPRARDKRQMRETHQHIQTASGSQLRVERRLTDDHLEVSLELEGGNDCVLHWALARSEAGSWRSPPRELWPEGTRPHGKQAVQTPFAGGNGSGKVLIRLHRDTTDRVIPFALFFRSEGRWDNNGGRDYHIDLGEPVAPAIPVEEVLRRGLSPEDTVREEAYEIGGEGRLAVAVERKEGVWRVTWVSDLGLPLCLHWGVAQTRAREWLPPPAGLWPQNTALFEGKAARSPFVPGPEHTARVCVEVDAGEAPIGIPFVLWAPASGAWLKNRGRDFFVPLRSPGEAAAGLGSEAAERAAEEIIERETGHHSWTLMHRFDLCHDLLDSLGDDPDGLALLYVWLRFSALRQLDWQRNYNTKPRELAHAQDRLTGRLAGLYADRPRSREWVRMMLVNLGRGCEGQRIRDEILEIMHRHRIKEVTGHFLEEWHQKLHNNTTPDDIVICEAYLAFLHADGDRDAFYRTLEAGGVTRARLEAYERPIRSEPDFVPHLKDALSHDFESFLRTLKALHSGVDLDTAIQAAWGHLNGDASEQVRAMRAGLDDSGLSTAEQAGRAVRTRRALRGLLEARSHVRELLYLDLSVEAALRGVVERSAKQDLRAEELGDLVGWLLEGTCLSHPDEELEQCRRDWEAAGSGAGDERTGALRGAAVLDRIERAVAAFGERLHRILQPRAEYLGKAFGAEEWTVELFAEEVVRGTLAFPLALITRRLLPAVRLAAGQGRWHRVSGGRGRGFVERVRVLAEVQAKRYGRPTVLVAETVTGGEEIPEGVTGIVTPSQVDALSHLAIRARNAGVLFAVCDDPGELDRIASHEGAEVELSVEASGEAVLREPEGEVAPEKTAARRAVVPRLRIREGALAVGPEDFGPETVGAKTLCLARLAGVLPAWARTPRSVAVPFGAFERVLDDPPNRGKRDEIRERLGRLDEDRLAEGLEGLRGLIRSLEPHEELLAGLRALMDREGLPHPGDEAPVWDRITRVWASMWNERAYVSRRANGIPHDAVHMAVLVQQVVEADHAFVLHTVDPLTGDPGRILAQVVPGLGETLVSNEPGSPLTAACPKGPGEPGIVAFPSKSTGLYGGGLIFRSDSSGEDLAGYAGAGLHDSYLLDPPRRVRIDYSRERLGADEPFTRDLLRTLADLGKFVEQAMGAPQDIEGAVAGGDVYVVQSRPQVGLTDA